MIRKLGNLGIAILAMAAISAPAASAAEFHAGSTFRLSGSQTGEDVTTFNAGVLKCNKINYTGELPGATFSALNLAPSFSECRLAGFVNTSVDTNGCEYVFHTGAEGSTEIVCPAGKSIAVTAFQCWVTIGPQTLKSVSYTNEEAEGSHDLRINTNLTGMSYTQHSKSFPGCANGTFNNGTSKGATTLKVVEETPGIWHE